MKANLADLIYAILNLVVQLRVYLTKHAHLFCITYHRYYFLLLILGSSQADQDIFPQVNSTWKVCMLKNGVHKSYRKLCFPTC